MAGSSPGIFNKIDEIRPPYMAPAYTDVKRIRDEVGDKPKLKAKGIKIATPLAGPRPGKAPIKVPRIAPIMANIMLSGVNATAKPCINKLIVSIVKTPIDLEEVPVQARNQIGRR